MTVLEEHLRKNHKLNFLKKQRPVAAAAGARLVLASSPLLLRRHRQRILGQQQQQKRVKAAAKSTQRRREPFSLMPAWMNINNRLNNNNNSRNNMWREQEPMMQENRMELDILTVRVIKSQVLNVLSDFGGSCCMLDVCMALKVSQGIKKTLLGSSSSSVNSVTAATTSDHHGFLGRGYFKLLFTLPFSAKKRRQDDASMHQLYRFMAALDALQATPSSSTTRISSWDEALEELKTLFRFSPRALQDLQRQEQEDYFDNDTAAVAEASLNDDDQNDIDKTTTYVEDLLDPMTDFQKRCHDAQDKNTFLELKESTKRWLQVMSAKVPAPPIRIPQDDDDDDAERGALPVVELDAADLALEQRLQLEEQKALQRQVPVAVQEAEARMRQQEEEMEQQLAEQARQAEARERAAALMRPFTDEEKQQIQTALYTIGPEDEIIAQAGTDSVQRGSIQTLRPGQWLNDEVIHYFLIMLTKRDEEMCRNDPNRKRCHFFKSFFITTLLNEGHGDPAMDGKYQYANVKRWSKKIPGKDIFKLDKIIFPINQSRVHWVCAVAFMQEKRIQFYDSFGGDGIEYLKSIMQYIKDEHKDKKKSPLPDEAEWELVPCQPGTPQQMNGYDCGVFTCMFADFVSKDCPLVFGQDHITLCRERIALSILKGTAIM